MDSFEGRVAVITGGASGIGLGLAIRLGEQGAKIVLADIQADALDRAVAQLTERGIEAIGVLTDVGRYEDVETLADAAYARFGAVHLLFNNAGVAILGPTWKLSLDDWRWVMDVNLWGVIHGIKAFVPRMQAQGGEARVINVSSEAAFFAVGTHTPYCATKFAVGAISQCLSIELAAEQSPVEVSCVCPGFVSTAIHRSARNRPDSDAPWSLHDREEKFLAAADTIQGQGIGIEAAADIILDGVRKRDFWVFTRPEVVDDLLRQVDHLKRTLQPVPVMAGQVFAKPEGE